MLRRRNALATATRTPRWCCRPRGRRAASDVPRRNLASRMVRLSAQGRGEAVERFATTAQALVRRRGLNEEWRWRREKTEERKERRRRRLGPNNTAQKLKEAMMRPLPCQCDAQTAMRATGSKPKLADGVAQAVNTVHQNYRIAIRQISQITPKFS